MSKLFVFFFITIFGTIGSYIPVLLGEPFFGGWSVFGSVVGGLFGIWAASWVTKRYGE